MASPTVASPLHHPLTPPADPTPAPGPASQSQPTTSNQPTQTTSSTTTRPLAPLLTSANPSTLQNSTSTAPGPSPSTTHLIHLLLSAHSASLTGYQPRVPLQLIDYAYRYTSAVLGDALHIQAEGYDTNTTASGSASAARGRGRGAGAGQEESDVSLAALRLAVHTRVVQGYQGRGGVGKEFLKGLGEERNRVGLGGGFRGVTGPGIGGDGDKSVVFDGMRLPEEKYVLSGVGWGVRGEWESEGEEGEEDVEAEREDVEMGDGDGGNEGEDADLEEDGEGRMEDVFGEDVDDGTDGVGAGDEAEDHEMGDS